MADNLANIGVHTREEKFFTQAIPLPENAKSFC